MFAGMKKITNVGVRMQCMSVIEWVSMYEYVLMCACMSISTYAWVYVSAHAGKVRKCSCVHECMCVSMWVRVRSCARVCTRMCGCVRIIACRCVCVCICTGVAYVCESARVHEDTYTSLDTCAYVILPMRRYVAFMHDYTLQLKTFIKFQSNIFFYEQ